MLETYLVNENERDQRCEVLFCETRYVTDESAGIHSHHKQ